MPPATPPRSPKSPRRSLLAALALAGACLFPAAAHATAASDLFDKGTTEFQAGNYDEALAQYQAAWKLTKSYDIAYSMALTEVHLGKMRDAVEHFAYALDHFPVTGEADLRKSAEDALADAKKSVATIRIKSSVKDIAVTLDGAAVDPATMGQEVYLTVGAHVIEASAPGFRSVKRTLDGTAGGAVEEVTLNLVPEPVTGRSLAPAYVLGGVGVIAVVAGAVLIGTAEGKKSDAYKLHDELASPEGCAAQAAKCKTLRDTASAADGLGNGGIAMMVFGGLAGAAAGLYIIVPSRKPGPGKGDSPARGDKPRASQSAPPGVTVSVAPRFAPGSGGVVLSGSF